MYGRAAKLSDWDADFRENPGGELYIHRQDRVCVPFGSQQVKLCISEPSAQKMDVPTNIGQKM